MKIDRKKVIFIVLILIGIGVRVWNFPEAIKEMMSDEIMTAVNAKSIVETGVDLSQNTFPVYLHGWGGQSVISLYLVVIAFKIFGISLFSLRLPMLIVSILALFVFYDLVKKLSQNENIALIALGLAVICPWQIQQSIWTLDCNMFPHFLLFAMDLLVTGIRTEKKKYTYISMVFYAISLYGYGLAIYFVPVFLLVVAIYLLKTKKLKIQDIMICVIIFLLVALPLLMMFVLNIFKLDTIKIGFITIPYYEGFDRTQDMLIFSENILSQLLSNAKSLLRVLVIENDYAEWNVSNIFGINYRIALIFAIIGVIKIIKEKRDENIIVFTWLILGLVIGLLINTVNINRLNLFWYLELLLAAYGIYYLYEKIKFKKVYKYGVLGVYACLFISFSVYFHTYYVKRIDMSGTFSRGFYQALTIANNSTQSKIYYTNFKNDGCLELYINFNCNQDKQYIELKESDELDEKLSNLEDDEFLIIDAQYEDYPEIYNYEKIEYYIIMHK